MGNEKLPSSGEPLLAALRRLNTSRAYRERTGRLYVEGVRNLLRCRDAGVVIERLVLAKRLVPPGAGQTAARRLRQEGVPAEVIPPDAFRRISNTARASGIGAVIRCPPSTLPEPVGDGLWLAVERVRSPGNLGTIIRTAAAFGVAGLIVTDTRTDPFDPAVVRASVGTLFGIRVCPVSPARLSEWTRHHDIGVVGADGQAEMTVDRFVFPTRCLIVVGDERKGLSSNQRAMCNICVRIPMVADVDSLNVGVATGIVLHAAAQYQTLRR